MYKTIFSFLKKYKKSLYLYFCIQCTTIAISMLVPYINGKIVDLITLHKSVHSLVRVIIVLTLLQILSVILYSINLKICTYIQLNSSNDFISATINHILMCKKSYLEKMNVTETVQQITNDSNALINFVYQSVVQIILTIIQLLFLGYIIIKIDLLLLLISILSGLLYFAYFCLNKDKIAATNKKFLNSQTKYYSSVFEWLNYWKFLKFHHDSELVAAVNENKRQVLDNLKKKQKVSVQVMEIIMLSKYIPQITLFIIGGIKVINGNLTIGLFIATITYLNMFLSSMESIYGFMNSHAEQKASYLRIDKLLSLDIEEFPKQKFELSTNTLIVRTENLSFQYRTDSELIKYEDIILKRGNLYSIKGDNGIGKSTYLDIISGLNSGEYLGKLKLDCCELSELDCYRYRKEYISYLFQDVSKLHLKCLLKNNNSNINFANEYAKDLFEKFKIKQLLSRKEFNFSGVSGGEQQKIAVFCCLNTNRPIILLDEPTNNLDSNSKLLLCEELKCLKRDKIVIIVSHDESILEFVDREISIRHEEEKENL
ncbi:ABC transporter ATP-binding protein [uncultured Dubosiella sp.]|nr:ABC transporter ATP-binding protein [uncultured Dubosiella sp.]